jgi:hypothetical protein
VADITGEVEVTARVSVVDTGIAVTIATGVDVAVGDVNIVGVTGEQAVKTKTMTMTNL